MENVTNILVLSASRRSHSNSELLARQVMTGAEQNGAQVEFLNLTSLHINSCEGCLGCVFRGKCSSQDDMGLLVEKFLEADGLILSAPIYILSPASIIKRIMDRALMMSLYIDELDRCRGSVTLTAAGKADYNPVGIEMLNQFAFAYGYPVYDYLEAYAPGPAEILLQDNLMAQAAALGSGLVNYLRGNEKRRPPAPNQCPSCYSRSFRLLANNTVQCPFCLIEGSLDEQGHVHVEASMLEDAFWTPKHRKRHLEDWIKATRGPYLKNRSLIKEKLKKYS